MHPAPQALGHGLQMRGRCGTAIARHPGRGIDFNPLLSPLHPRMTHVVAGSGPSRHPVVSQEGTFG